MARFITGNTFGTTDTVTSTTLNNAVNNAKISTDSVDGSTIEVNSDALRLKDAGITTAKIPDSSSKTTGVTFAKMQHISTAKVLGRASASEGDVEEAFDFKDEDNMASNSATALASQQSIKAYADSTAASTRSFSKPDFIGTFAAVPAADTDVTVTHSLGTTDLIYFIQMKLPSGAITQMNPALTFPFSDIMKPTGLSVFIETNTFSCRSGRGWAFWREQGVGTGTSASSLNLTDSRSGYEFRIIAYKLS